MKPSRKLTLKQLEKFERLVRNHTQADAMVYALREGMEFSILEAKLAGIADPRRVIFNIRNGRSTVNLPGSIETIAQITKDGNTVYRYSFKPRAKRSR